MRETCDWARWSRELARKIAEGGEQYLIDKAKLVAWRDDDKESLSQPFRLLRYRDENIDPLSFFYTLASLSNASTSRERIYPSVAEAFGMTRDPAFPLGGALLQRGDCLAGALVRGHPLFA